MKRIRTLSIVAASVVGGALALLLLWCRLDGAVSVNRGFVATQSVRIKTVRVYPFLEAAGQRRQSGILFKERREWYGPYALKLNLRDEGRVYAKARLTRCVLSSPDGAWTQSLAVWDQSRGGASSTP